MFTRVVADERGEHPSLAQVHFRTRTHPYIEGATEAVAAHGDAATAAALEAVLVRVVELVGRLIGEDMATKLIERSRESADYSDTSAFRQQEEA